MSFFVNKFMMNDVLILYKSSKSFFVFFCEFKLQSLTMVLIHVQLNVIIHMFSLILLKFGFSCIFIIFHSGNYTLPAFPNNLKNSDFALIDMPKFEKMGGDERNEL